MKLRIDKVRSDGDRLIIKTDYQSAARAAYALKKGTYDIEKHKHKRSNEANAYFWTLCDKLAEKAGIPKSEVYRHSIREIGGVSETYCMKTQAVERFCKAWNANGIGWQTEQFPSKIEGCTNVTAYFGSSTFDTAQMSRLIDNIVQDCKACGIETLTSEELERMMQRERRKNV